MPSFTAYKGSKEGKIVKTEVTTPDLTDDQILVKITATGLCGTDEHYKHAHMTLGHEGAGVVEELGPNVKDLKKGDRVGFGYLANACGRCDLCLTGQEIYCENREMYGAGNSDQGSFGSHVVWRESFLFKIPDALTDEVAAPLMCAGATVFNALYSYNVKAGDRVGVVGLGGLGHLAIQYAAKMGFEVVVFSGSESKKDEAMKLGATEFIAMKGKTELNIGRKLNALVVSTSVSPDWKIMLPVMAPNSKIFPITASQDNFEIPHMGLLSAGITVQGTLVSSRAVHRKMLEFSAQNNIKPILMEFPLDVEGIEKAMATLREGNMRYRGVLKPQ